MKLWRVSKKTPPGRRERKARLQRMIVMAESKEAAVALMRAVWDAFDAHEASTGAAGGLPAWSAEEIENGWVNLGTFTSEKE